MLGAEQSDDPYASYGKEMPNCIPGSPQYWKVFGLDLIAMTQTKGLPDFFVTLTVNDAWPHIQATVKSGWGAAEKTEDIHLEAATNSEAVGTYPDISVMAAEVRFQWFMKNYLKNAKESPLGKVVDYVWKNEYQKRGAVHWHMLLWIEPRTIPDDAVTAEMPRANDTNDPTAHYIRKLVKKLQMHGTCTPKCFQKAFGHTTSKCKFRFPYHVPQESHELNEDNTRYFYKRHHDEDKLVVPYNLEMLVVLGAGINVQRVSKHGFEMYLAKYISKAEPTTNIELPENASTPERYLKTREIGAIEALEILMSSQQHSMSRLAIYLPTEVKPVIRVLKEKRLLEDLPAESEDIFYAGKFKIYLQRADHLKNLTYPDYFKWWYQVLPGEQSTAVKKVNEQKKHFTANDDNLIQNDNGDFDEYYKYKSVMDKEVSLISRRIKDNMHLIPTDSKMTATLLELEKAKYPQNVIDIFVETFLNESLNRVENIDETHVKDAERFLQKIDIKNSIDIFSKPHWLHDDFLLNHF